jgi:hypothetical protein
MVLSIFDVSKEKVLPKRGLELLIDLATYTKDLAPLLPSALQVFKTLEGNERIINILPHITPDILRELMGAKRIYESAQDAFRALVTELNSIIAAGESQVNLAETPFILGSPDAKQRVIGKLAMVHPGIARRLEADAEAMEKIEELGQRDDLTEDDIKGLPQGVTIAALVNDVDRHRNFLERSTSLVASITSISSGFSSSNPDYTVSNIINCIAFRAMVKSLYNLPELISQLERQQGSAGNTVYTDLLASIKANVEKLPANHLLGHYIDVLDYLAEQADIRALLRCFVPVLHLVSDLPGEVVQAIRESAYADGAYED